MSTLTADEITAEDVLGALIWRLQNQGHIPPRILCMSEEARQRNRDLARETIEGMRQNEREAEALRSAGDPRAFFGEPARHG